MDVDLDFSDREKILKLIKHIPATIEKPNGNRIKHNSGVYVTDIPIDPINKISNIDYEAAEKRGYIKLDFLNVGIYNQIQSEEELDILMNIDPPWARLLDQKFCERVIHLGNHYDIVKLMKPTSIDQLAIILAIIRPGKRHLVGKSWSEIAKTVWEKTTDGTYAFKKSHSFSYAFLVIVHINILNLQDSI